MARIDVLPSIEIIRGFKGILDFYMWRGLPCVRAWPHYRPARQTDASLAAALTFGAIVQAYSLLANLALQAYREDALDQPRTARDIMVTGAFGNLHEASMSDFLDALIIIRDGVVALTDLLHALDSIDTDEIVVNVDQSVLPPLAATTTNQATQITALQKLDDLQDALQSKALDRFLVRGMDQLYSLLGTLENQSTGPLSLNDGYRDSGPPAAGVFWKLTSLAATNTIRAVTRVHMYRRTGALNYCFFDQVAALPAGDWAIWTGELWLAPTDVIRVYFTGALQADVCVLDSLGHVMTVET